MVLTCICKSNYLVANHNCWAAGAYVGYVMALVPVYDTDGVAVAAVSILDKEH